MKIVKYFKSEKQIESDINYTGVAKYMPLIICGGFYLITILLFVFGPFEWNIVNKKELYLFLTFTLIALIIGYIIGVKIKRKKKFVNLNINHIMYISFIVYILIYLLNCYVTTGKIYPDLIRGILDSGTAYAISHSTFSSFATYLVYISIITAPITAFIVPCFFIYYKELNKLSKAIGYMVIFLNFSIGVAQGVINSYAVLAFQICMFLLIYLFSNYNKKSFKKKLSIFLVIILIATSFIVYYKVVMSNRLIKDTESETEVTGVVTEVITDKDGKKDNKGKNQDKKQKNDKTKSYTSSEVEDMLLSSAEYISQTTIKENYFYSFLPDSIKNSINHIISYITHGYKGLSFTFDKNFTSSYGLGFSDFFRHNFLKVIGSPELESVVYSRTYMSKIIANGWETGPVWSTFFIYPASDIGFVFTVVLVAVIGLILSLSWRDALESKNVFASIIFINFCMIICFFCANNSYFQNGGSFLTIGVIGFLWIATRIFGKE